MEPKNVIGLMSGTSCDSIDAALCSGSSNGMASFMPNLSRCAKNASVPVSIAA